MTNLNGAAVYPDFEVAKGVVVSRNCGVLFKGNFYVYGGDRSSTYHQIAKVQNCKLEKIGELPFRLTWGGCAANSNTLFLCFNYRGNDEDYKTCHVSSEATEKFIEIPRSHEWHCQIRTAASEGKPFCISFRSKY